MFGRQVALVLRARLPRCIPTRSATNDLLRRASRHYATPGRPRKSVGEPSRPVKRAVKQATVTADKPAAATTTTSTVAATKAAPKKKAGAKKKKKTKKVLTPKQVQAKAVKEERAKMRQLRTAALDVPFPKGKSTYTHFLSARWKVRGGEIDQSARGSESTLAMTKSITAEWHNLSPAEMEHWNHEYRMHANASRAEFQRWVEAHSEDEIRAANRARRRMNKKGSGRKWRIIPDERTAKRPLPEYPMFMRDRVASGDFANIDARDRMTLIGKEWRALGEEEKQKYRDVAIRARQQYDAEHGGVDDSPPPDTKSELQAAAGSA